MAFILVRIIVMYFKTKMHQTNCSIVTRNVEGCQPFDVFTEDNIINIIPFLWLYTFIDSIVTNDNDIMWFYYNKW